MDLEYCLSVLDSYFGTVFTPQFAVFDADVHCCAVSEERLLQEIRFTGMEDSSRPKKMEPGPSSGHPFQLSTPVHPAAHAFGSSGGIGGNNPPPYLNDSGSLQGKPLAKDAGGLIHIELKTRSFAAALFSLSSS